MNKLVFLLLTMIGCGFGSGQSGWHRGKIVDVGEGGWFCKTYEGQIMSGSGNAAISVSFTISTEEVFHKLAALQKEDKEVDVHYFSPRIYWACRSWYSNVVDEVIKTVSKLDSE